MMSLADAILDGDLAQVRERLRYQHDLNQLDEYGFTPLIEAAIANNTDLAALLIDHGANANLPDSTGGTALHWAAENNNIDLCQILLRANADPNAYNFAGQPVMVMPYLRQQQEIKRLLQAHGADLYFTQDYVNTKLLGHMFELVGTANIVDPKNQFVEVDFEGFFLEVSLAMICESLLQFQNHFAARKLRRFASVIQLITQALQRAIQLIKLQQYQTDRQKHADIIQNLLSHEPLIIPVGYEGHAITFIKMQNLLVKCDRREDSRLYDNIVFYQVNDTQHFSKKLFQHLLYEKVSDQFINEDLEKILNLSVVTELKIAAQVSGNCSWANVEACLPSIFFMMLMISQSEKDMAKFKSLAMNFYHQWRDWNRERALHFCLKSFKTNDKIRNLCKAEIIAAILFQTLKSENFADKPKIEAILEILFQPDYIHIVENYVKIYVYQSQSSEGQAFAQLLKSYGYTKI